MHFIWECEYPSFSSVFYRACMKIKLWRWTWRPTGVWQKRRASISCIYEWLTVMISVPSSLLCSLSNCIKCWASSDCILSGQEAPDPPSMELKAQLTLANEKFKGNFRLFKTPVPIPCDSPFLSLHLSFCHSHTHKTHTWHTQTHAWQQKQSGLRSLKSNLIQIKWLIKRTKFQTLHYRHWYWNIQQKIISVQINLWNQHSLNGNLYKDTPKELQLSQRGSLT